MSKGKIVFLAFVFFVLSAGAHAQTSKPININDLPNPNLYKAIVKVKLFAINSSGFLSNLGHGSGVMIDNNGTILTNYHVAANENDFYDGKMNKIGYNICVVEDINKEPNCAYTADYIAGDKELDLALLKLRSFPKGANLYSLPFLPIAQTDSALSNDEVVAMGFPGIGGDTLSLTKGVVAGKIDKYGKKWIKTDALISYGNSGGAAINNKGELIGITSQGHSDFMGSMGYVINSVSIVDWVKKNINKKITEGDFKERIAAFAEVEKGLVTKLSFTSVYGGFSATRPEKWQFRSGGENNLSISIPDDYDAGSVSISADTIGYAPTANELDRTVDMMVAVNGFFGQVLKKEKIQLANSPAFKITMSSNSGSVSQSIIAINEGLVFNISYSYGKNDKDKAVIDNVIKSIKLIKPLGQKKSVFTYQNKDEFKYNIKTGADWPMIVEDSQSPVTLGIIKRSGVMGAIMLMVDKEVETAASLSNEQTLANGRKSNKSVESYLKDEGGTLGYKANANCSLTAKHKAIYEEIVITMNGESRIMIVYTLRRNGKVLKINGGFFGPTKKISLATAKEAMNSVLKGFVLEDAKFVGKCSVK